MRTLLFCLISAFVFYGCPGYVELPNFHAVIFKYQSGHALIFSNETEFTHNARTLADSRANHLQIHYIHIDDLIQQVDSIPIRPDTIITLQEGGINFLVYRYFSTTATSVIADVGGIGIGHVDVYFDQKRVKFFKVETFYG